MSPYICEKAKHKPATRPHRPPLFNKYVTADSVLAQITYYYFPPQAQTDSFIRHTCWPFGKPHVCLFEPKTNQFAVQLLFNLAFILRRLMAKNPLSCGSLLFAFLFFFCLSFSVKYSWFAKYYLIIRCIF